MEAASAWSPKISSGFSLIRSTRSMSIRQSWLSISPTCPRLNGYVPTAGIEELGAKEWLVYLLSILEGDLPRTSDDTALLIRGSGE